MMMVLISGCGISNKQTQTEYQVNEEAFIDYYQITCNNYEIIDSYDAKTGKFLKVNYTLTNNSDEQKEIHLQDDFKLYLNDDIILAMTNDNVILNSSETKKIEIAFDLSNMENTSEPYKVIFYSNVVTNNIAFVLGSAELS